MERIPPSVIIDIFFLILCLRISYIAVSRGIVCEGFKLIAVLVSGLCSFQWYKFLDTYTGRVPFLNKQYLDFISFLVIFFSIHTIISLIRFIITSLFKRKEIPVKERWISLFVGALRAVFLSSIILFMLHLSSFNPQYLAQSISLRTFKNIAPKLYLITAEIASGAGDKKSLINKEVREYYETAAFLSGDNSKGN